MFDKIRFYQSENLQMKKDSLAIEDILDSILPEERVSRLSAFGVLSGNTDYYVSGHTSILFPPVDMSLSSEHLLVPQGFYLCDHWAGYFQKRENYRSYMLSYTISGEGVLEYEGSTYSLKEHDVFLIDCRKYQYYHTKGSNWKHVDVHFYGGCADTLYHEFISINGPVCRANNTMLQHFESLATIWDTAKIYPALYISNKLSEILAYLLTLSKSSLFMESQINTFSRTMEYIETHISEELRLEELAASASMSKYHFSRLFKKHTGLSPIDYVIHLRIARARSMLTDTDLPLKYIAFAVGFRDINNFTKQFKKIENKTPSAYRQQFHSN